MTTQFSNFLLKMTGSNENRASKMKFFGCQEIFFMNFDFKNGCKNEFKDNNEKSCS